MQTLLNPYFIFLLVIFLSVFIYVVKHEEYIPGFIFFVFASLGAVLQISNLGQVGLLKAVLLLFLAAVLISKKMKKVERLPLFGMSILFVYLLTIYISGTINNIPLSDYRAELGLIVMAMVIALSPNRADTFKAIMIGVFLWGLINAIVVVLAKLGFRWGGLVLFNEGGRAIGLSRHSTFMGAYFSIALVAAQILFIQARLKLVKVILFGCGLLIMLGLLATIARGAFIGWLAAFLYIQYRIQGMKVGSVVGIFAAAIIGIAAASMLGLDQLLLDRFTGMEKDSSAQARLPLLLASLETVANHLFLGAGIGWKDTSMNLQSHNMFMQVLVESGVVGFIIFMFILWKAGWSLLRRSNSTIVVNSNTESPVDSQQNKIDTNNQPVYSGVTLRKPVVKLSKETVDTGVRQYYVGLVAMLGAILLNSLTHSFDFFLPIWVLIGVGFMREEV